MRGLNSGGALRLLMSGGAAPGNVGDVFPRLTSIATSFKHVPPFRPTKA